MHERPGLTRAEVAHALGASTGTISELVARLAEGGLLAEEPAPPSGARGRPTRRLVPHPSGPLAIGAVVGHEGWRVRVVELGGGVLEEVDGAHVDPGDARAVLRTVAEAAADLERRRPARVRGVGLAVPGPVRDGHVVDAPLLGWRDVDLRTQWPGPVGGPVGPSSVADAERAALVVAGNDATLAAAGEARRGAARDAGTHLHLLLEAGMGGAITVGGQALEGARGAAGEFGHLPFGDPAVACPCGARRCWGRTLDGEELARLLAEPSPADPVAYSARVLDRASTGDARALAAAARLGTALGAGTAGLVNALDPELVTLGGLARRLLEIVPDDIARAYRDGLMTFRRSAPPTLVPAALRDAAPLVGVTERIWDQLWGQLR